MDVIREAMVSVGSWLSCSGISCRGSAAISLLWHSDLFTNPIVLGGGVVLCMVAFSGSLYAGGVVLTFRIWGFSVWSVCR